MEALKSILPITNTENPFLTEEIGVVTTTTTTYMDRIKSTFIAMTPQNPIAKYVFYLIAIAVLVWLAYSTVIFVFHVLIVVLIVYIFSVLILWFKEVPK